MILDEPFITACNSALQTMQYHVIGSNDIIWLRAFCNRLHGLDVSYGCSQMAGRMNSLLPVYRIIGSIDSIEASQLESGSSLLSWTSIDTSPQYTLHAHDWNGSLMSLQHYNSANNIIYTSPDLMKLWASSFSASNIVTHLILVRHSLSRTVLWPVVAVSKSWYDILGMPRCS